MFYKKRGFTLIELLVVIAIIGILATIVLINLNAARNKAKDAAIKGALSEARAAAEVEYDDAGGSYAAVCADGDIQRIKTNVEANGGTYSCNNAAAAYCVQSTLNTAGSWCVDYQGLSGSTSVLCSSSNIKCD